MRLTHLIGILIVVPAMFAMVLVDARSGRSATATSAQAGATQTNATFYNDASTPGADPFILYDADSGYHYAYSTDGADPGYQFAIYRSPDLATWEHIPGGALKMSDGQWGRDWFWAPEVYHNSETGLFFLFYSARMRDGIAEHFRYADFEEPSKIGVAVSDSPMGPFRNIVDQPIDYRPYDPDYRDVNLIMDEEQKKPPATQEEANTAPLGTYLPFIDPNVFFDDGRIYLYYSRNAYRNWVWDDDLGKFIEESNIYAVELTADWWNDPTGTTMPAIHPRYVNANRAPDDPPDVRKDGFTPILDYGSDKQAWENAHVNDYEQSNGEYKNRRWEEGSTTIKTTSSDGRAVYFLLYSANNYANEFYGVGYAVSDNPLGPWKKSSANPVLEQNEQVGMYSTGHGSPARSPDGTQLYYVHHGRPDTGTNRRLYTAGMSIDADTASVTIGQSTQDQPIPSGVAPYTLESESALIDLTGEPRRVDWAVTTEHTAAMDLSNSLNRVSLTMRPSDAVRVEKYPNYALLHGVPAGVAAMQLRYQRQPARGEYFDVDNIVGSGTPEEQHRPVALTLPVTECDSMITGEHPGDLVVSEGVTCLRDATVLGDVRVNTGGSLVSVAAELRGTVRVANAATTWLLDSQVRGDVEIRDSSGIVRVDGTTVEGSVSLLGNSGPVITDSHVGQTLSCQRNEPVPSNEGRPNTVDGDLVGQCAQM